MMRVNPHQKNENANYVLDTYALQEFLASEAGADDVEELLRAAAAGRAMLYVSWISLAEIYYVTRTSPAKDSEIQARATIEGLQRLAIQIEPAGEEEALKAGAIKARFN